MLSPFGHAEVLHWLREEDPTRLEHLFASADATRAANVGPAVHLRALVEISNRCVRQCHYCGLRGANTDLTRYRMSHDEILACARLATKLGYGTIVMQAGEDPSLGQPFITDLIGAIKSETPLAITLSLGERPPEDLVAWKAAGADRYLLRFETSDRGLFDRIHPSLPGQRSDRIAILRQLRALGYEVGSGVMVGIPGQSLASIADDILLFRQLDLDMIGIGPFIPHRATPLGQPGLSDFKTQNPELLVYKTLALTRLACPQANIPSTSALATINQANGRELGLARGANVVMPNLTPQPYRTLYQIYPGKACITEDAAACNGCLRRRILNMHRTIATGSGGRIRHIPPVGDLRSAS